MARSLQGKSAIVTGAGSGINLEFARILLENGVNVLFADLSLRPEAQEVLEKYTDRPKAIFQKTNVVIWKDLTQMFTKAEEEFGGIDIVCPGAGVFEPPSSSFWYPPGSPESRDDVEKNHYMTLEVNLTHPIRVTQMAISRYLAASPAPTQDNRKYIVHVVSVAGQTAFLPFPLYHASKWGLTGFIHSLADLETTLGIRIVGVAPGAVKTPLWTDNEDKRRYATKDGVLQDDWITPRCVAEKMLALVTEDTVEQLGGNQLKIEGGLVLEVGAAHVREVPIWGNTGPASDQPGMSVTNMKEALGNAYAQVQTRGWGQ